MIIQLSVNNEKNEEVKWQTFFHQYFDNNNKKNQLYLNIAQVQIARNSSMVRLRDVF